MSWQVTILVAVVLLVSFLGQKASPRFRHLLWCLVLLKLCLPPSLAFVTGIGHWLPSTPAAHIESRSETPAPVGPTVDTVGDISSSTTAPADTVVPCTTVFLSSTLAKAAGPEVRKPTVQPSWSEIMFGVWIAGMVGMIGLLSLQYARIRRSLLASRLVGDPKIMSLLGEIKENLQVKSHVRLLAAPRLASPILMGLLRPRIVIPADALKELPERQLKAVILHELAHFRRRDLWVNWVQVILQTIYWFHPLVWLANFRLRQEGEMIVDDLVLTYLEGDHQTYGTSLVNVVKQAARKYLLAPGYVGIVETMSLLCIGATPTFGGSFG